MKIRFLGIIALIIIISNGKVITSSLYGEITKEDTIINFDSVIVILDNFYSSLGKKISVRGRVSYQIFSSIPDSLFPFIIQSGGKCSPIYRICSGGIPAILLASEKINLKSYFNSIISDHNLYKDVTIIGYLREKILPGMAISPLPYIEVISIDSISSIDIKNNNSKVIKKNDKIEILDGKIVYLVDKPSYVSVEILNTKGILVKTLISGRHSSGWHKLYLDESFSKDSGISKGSYFVRLSIDGESILVKKLILTH